MLRRSHERIPLGANCSLKENFDVWKWRWVSLKERPTGVSVPREGGKRRAWRRVLSWLRDVITWRHSGLLMHTVTHTQTNSGEPQRSTSWPPNLWFGWDESLPQHHTETDWELIKGRFYIFSKKWHSVASALTGACWLWSFSPPGSLQMHHTWLQWLDVEQILANW